MSHSPLKLHLNFAVQGNADGTLSYGLRTSCPEDLRRCHEMREMHAVMVGAETFRLEHPRLTARPEFLGREPVHQPVRIIATRTGIADLPEGYLEIRCPDGDIEAGLAKLASQGIQSIFVEGGPTLHRGLLRRKLYSSATVYIRGDQPEKLIPGVFELLPGLPRNYRMRPLGEGFLLQFDFLQSILDPHVPAECALPTEFGKGRLIAFEDPAHGLEHAALVIGDPATFREGVPALVRIHSSCWTGDLLGSKRCDCGQQLRKALSMIQREGRGILLYLNQEGRGIGLRAKTLAYTLQQQGANTYEANERLGLPVEARDFSFAVHALKRIGVDRIRLLTNNPDKVREVVAAGIKVTEQVTLGGAVNDVNLAYLTAKVELGHHNPGLLH